MEMNSCVILILSMVFGCEPPDTVLYASHVDNSVGLYFREYRDHNERITTIYQLAPGTDLNAYAVDVRSMPLMVEIGNVPYLVHCESNRCTLERY